MKKNKLNNEIIVWIIITILVVLSYLTFQIQGLIIFLMCLIILEFLTQYYIDILRERFQWLITEKKDFPPKLDPAGLYKFFKQGYDSELGWVRKPNTEHDEQGKFGKTMWHMNEKGSRLNPNHEQLPSLISCYGDSFTFSRQVNDNETWEHYLSKLTQTNVLNWGIGNHGADQSVLRIKKEFPKNKTKLVIMGVVPDTLSRIMSVWKHFYEYGNVFAFKPRFKLNDNKLSLIKNIIDTEEKYFEFDKYLNYVIEEDYFYHNKFKNELIKFPYIISVLKNPKRNLPLIYWNTMDFINEKFKRNSSKYKDLAMAKIMNINLWWRLKLYQEKEVTDLFIKIIKEFVDYSKKENFTPIFAFLPQKDDISFIKKNYHFYNKFKLELKQELKEDLFFFDLSEELLNVPDLDKMYSDNTEYGGHFSKFGNEFVANNMFKFLKENKLI